MTSDATTPAARDARILLVEDEPNMARSLARILTRRGYVVAVANSGQEALTQLAEEHFQAVVTDLNMPVMACSSCAACSRTQNDAAADLRRPSLTGHGSTRRPSRP